MHTSGEVLVEGQRIAEAGSAVRHPPGAEIIDLGDRTLLPGSIDAHVHLFLHPGAEDLQTVVESVPQRTIQATLAARFGVKPLAALQAGTLNGAKLLGWAGSDRRPQAGLPGRCHRGGQRAIAGYRRSRDGYTTR